LKIRNHKVRDAYEFYQMANMGLSIDPEKIDPEVVRLMQHLDTEINKVEKNV